MAVTSLWRVKGYIGKVVLYAMNPEKTTETETFNTGSSENNAQSTLGGVVSYVERDEATNQKSLVYGIMCHKDTAVKDMMAVKNSFRKTDGVIAYHGYQSFAEGEVTPDTAHEIGKALAKELWGDRFQVLVTTHLDKDSHIHNHFVINTVSFVDGKKFHRTKEDYYRMKTVSDRLCREYNLSVIDNPKFQTKNYGEWLAEQNGATTIRGTIRQDIDRAIDASLTDKEFYRYMKSLGYELRLTGSYGQEIKSMGLKPPGAERFFRFSKLGEGYSIDDIRERIFEKSYRKLPFTDEEKENYKKYRETMKPLVKATGLHALYLHYCYELHIIVKYPASVKRVSIFMREDLNKLDQLDAQTRFIGANRIETMSDLERIKNEKQEQYETLIHERGVMRNALKKAVRNNEQPEIDEKKKKIGIVSEQIGVLRKELKLCDQIKDRSEKRETELKDLYAQQITNRKENKEYELPRRSGGTSR